MATRLNYTKRKRIHNDDVHLQGRSDGRTVRLVGDISLQSSLDYPDTARLCLYVKRSSYYRESFLIEQKLRDVVSVDIELEGIEDLQGVAVDVKIIDTASDSRIVLALCRQFRIVSEQGDQSSETIGLLGARRGDFDLPFWKLNYEGLASDGAWIDVSRLVDDYRAFTMRQDFQTLVLPDLVRQMAQKILIEDCYRNDPNAGQEPKDLWVRWFLSLEGVGSFDPDCDEDVRISFVDDIHVAFCRVSGLSNQIGRMTGEEG